MLFGYNGSQPACMAYVDKDDSYTYAGLTKYQDTDFVDINPDGFTFYPDKTSGNNWWYGAMTHYVIT